jgi:hypothetical protein
MAEFAQMRTLEVWYARLDDMMIKMLVELYTLGVIVSGPASLRVCCHRLHRSQISKTCERCRLGSWYEDAQMESLIKQMSLESKY